MSRFTAGATFGLVLVLSACDGDPSRTPSDAGALSRDDASIDGGAENGADGSVDAAVSDSGPPLVLCKGQTALRIEPIPEDIFAFHHLSAECEALKPVIMLRNSSSSSMRIDKVEVSPAQFSVLASGLPRELLPDEALSVAVGFASDEPTAIDGTLTILGPDGCIELPVHGNAVDDSLTSQSAYALDFGEVPAGSTSAPREFTILSQRAASLPATTLFNGFTVGPKPTFQFVTAPADVTPNSCEEIKLSIVFNAPATLGQVEGDLSWYTMTPTGEGVAGAQLFGTSVAP